MYSFLFDRKSLILLLAGLATVGCLLYFAGVLTGVYWGLPGSAEAVAAPPPAAPAAFSYSRPCPPAAVSGETPDDRDFEPVPIEAPEGAKPSDGRESPPRQVATFGEVAPEERRNVPAPRLDPALAEASALAASRPSPPRQAPSRAASSTSTERTVLAQTAASAPSPIAEARADSLGAPTGLPGPVAPETTPLATAEPASIRNAVYSLQIGAFRRPENSAKIVQDLQSRGYDAYVVEEGGTRAIRTVRVGRFGDRDEAQRAAADFRRREGKTAIVRPLDS